MALVDFEMGDAQIDEWLRDQGIQAAGRVLVAPVRGKAASFNILDPVVRAEWVRRLRGQQVQYLVVDCLRPILDALGLDEHKDAGQFLVALDALLNEAGIGEALLVHHMGHAGERARGDSRLRDWPDAEWRLVRKDEQPDSERYIVAYGRDVDVAETLLGFDRITRHLSLAGGSRRDADAVAAFDDVWAVLAQSDGPMSGRGVQKALKESEHSRAAVGRALKLGRRLGGGLVVTKGDRNADLYSIDVSAPVRRSAPPVRQNTAIECASARVRLGHGAVEHSGGTIPPLHPTATGAAPTQEAHGEQF